MGRVGVAQIVNAHDDMELAEGLDASEELSMIVHFDVYFQHSAVVADEDHDFPTYGANASPTTVSSWAKCIPESSEVHNTCISLTCQIATKGPPQHNVAMNCMQ